MRRLALSFCGLLVGSTLATGQPQQNEPRGFQLRPLPAVLASRYSDPPGEVITFSADGKLVAGVDRGTVRVWEVASEQEKTRVHLPEPQAQTMIAFPADGKTLVVAGGTDPAVRWFELTTGKQVKERDLPQLKQRTPFRYQPVTRLSPAGDWLVTTDASGETPVAVVLDTATGARKAELKDAPAFSFQGILPAGDRPILITGSNTAVAQIWDVATGRLLRTIGEHGLGRRPVGRVLATSVDGKLFVTSTWNTTDRSPGQYRLEVWGVDDGRRRCSFAAPTNVTSAALSADGRSLVAAGSGRVVVYDLLRDELENSYSMPQNAQYQVASRDGKTLAVVSMSYQQQAGGRVSLAPFPDLTDPFGKGDLVGDQVTGCLEMLGAANEFRGRRAVQVLASRPEQATDILSGRLKPEPDRGRAIVADLIKTLDDNDPDIRDKALNELLGLAHRFEPLLVAAHAAAPPGEVRNRLTTALNAVRDDAPPADLLSDMRAVEVLEKVGTAAAKGVLTKLAGGSAESGLTKAAAEALARLKKAGR